MSKKKLGLSTLLTPDELWFMSMLIDNKGKKQLKAQLEFEKKNHSKKKKK